MSIAEDLREALREIKDDEREPSIAEFLLTLDGWTHRELQGVGSLPAVGRMETTRGADHMTEEENLDSRAEEILSSAVLIRQLGGAMVELLKAIIIDLERHALNCSDPHCCIKHWGENDFRQMPEFKTLEAKRGEWTR